MNCPECVVAWIIWTDNATSCQANFPTRESATLSRPHLRTGNPELGCLMFYWNLLDFSHLCVGV